jgi:uncharacterized RDD family membrane protein YckC
MEEQKIASLGSRVGGAFIDLIVVLLLTGVVTLVWGFFIGLNGSESYLTASEAAATWKARGFLAGLLVDCIYNVLMMAGAKQSTYGQRAVGIKIIKDNGEPIGYGTAIGRWIVSIFSSVLLKVGFLIAIFTNDKKTLHDLVAKTKVVQSNVELESSYENTNINSVSSNSNNAYLLALNEYETNNIDRGLYAKLFAENEGNEAIVKAKYIKQKAENKIKFEKYSKQNNVNYEEKTTDKVVSTSFDKLDGTAFQKLLKEIGAPKWLESVLIIFCLIGMIYLLFNITSFFR